jgi:uncharacterized membrane protein YvbJ
MLTSCPDCGRSVSYTAQACPQCGCHFETHNRWKQETALAQKQARINRRKRLWGRIAWTIVLVVLTFACIYAWNIAHLHP